MDNDDDGVWPRKHDYARTAPAIPAFTRAAVLGIHVLLRLQSEQRRVQAHGTGALRPAEVSRSHYEASHRHQGRRKFLARHALFQVLPGADDDRRAVPRSFRWSPTGAGVES